MNLNDEKLKNLKALGYTGTIDDAYRAFLMSVTTSTGTINDLERLIFSTAGFTGSINDMWEQHLDSQGITTGSLNDRMLVAWTTISGAGLADAAYSNLEMEDGFNLLQEDGYLFVL